jgi:hypothetical protein
MGMLRAAKRRRKRKTEWSRVGRIAFGGQAQAEAPQSRWDPNEQADSKVGSLVGKRPCRLTETLGTEWNPSLPGFAYFVYFAVAQRRFQNVLRGRAGIQKAGPEVGYFSDQRSVVTEALCGSVPL